MKSFVMYTTSWQDSFVADNDNVEICQALKPWKNIPKDIELKKNDSVSFKCILRLTEKYSHNYSFRIGLVYANWHQHNEIEQDGIDSAKKYFDALIIRRMNKLKHKIYWSNEITSNDELRGYDQLDNI